MHVVERNVLLSAIRADDARRFRREAKQSLDGVRGLAARLEFQHLAQKHEGGDNCGGLEIYGDAAVRATERVGEDARYKRRHQAIEVCDAGTNGD